MGLLLGGVRAVIGAVFLGVGAIPGAGAEVIIAEYHRREDWRQAIKAGGVQLLIALPMILIFVWQVLRE